jgi:hypothetical protein
MSNSELRKRKGQIMRAVWRVLRDQGESARGKRSRFRVRPIALGLLGALAAVNSLASQEPQSRGDSPTDPGFVFHQTVRRVRVDVTVTDAQGMQTDTVYSASQPSGPGGALASREGSMRAISQFGAPPSHQLIFAAQVDAIGAPAPATAVQMAALDPYLEQADKAAGRKFVKPTAPIPMQQYAIQYAVLASQLDLDQSENGVYRPHVALTALAFNAEGETLWGFNTRIEDVIPATEIGNILQNGYRAVQLLLVPVNSAVIRLVVYDENSGRVGSMEVRVPL